MGSILLDIIRTFNFIIRLVNNYHLTYLHPSKPFSYLSSIPNTVTEIAKHYRPLYRGVLMINNGFDQLSGNKVLEDGLADLVAFGKTYISNPYLAERFSLDVPLTDWDQSTFYTPGKKGI